MSIHWPEERKKELKKILRSGSFSLPFAPTRCRAGATVYLADGNGDVHLRFVLKEAVKRAPQKGVILVARARTVRPPRSSDFQIIPINRSFSGTLRYLWPGTNIPDDENPRGGPSGITPIVRKSNPPTISLLSNTLGKTLNQPERQLVKAYTSWIDRPEIFSHRRLPEPGLYTDLFIGTTYTLVEAKAWSHREALRMAIGQLFDYQRYIKPRHPSLAVLLRHKPSVAMIELFASKRISVIWKSRGNSFADNAEGRYTTKLRGQPPMNRP